jgi:hypothetical protein
MKNTLPIKIRKYETGIINLDQETGEGTHWTAYVKKGRNISYFDSFGNLKPTEEAINYFFSDGSKNIVKYNYDKYQSFNTTICGQLCLQFIYNNV